MATREKIAVLPKAIQESIIERSTISAAIANCNEFIKYARKCNKYAKDKNYKETDWRNIGINSLRPHYNRLLDIEPLVNKYHALWLDKFIETKTKAEKLIGI